MLVIVANALTGGGRGLGLCMAEGLAEAGGRVHCLDRALEAPQTFLDAQERLKGQLEYHKVDVTDDQELRQCIENIAAKRQRLDGLIAGTSISASNRS
jgi:D-arabinitol 2-dehydrogenase